VGKEESSERLVLLARSALIRQEQWVLATCRTWSGHPDKSRTSTEEPHARRRARALDLAAIEASLQAEKDDQPGTARTALCLERRTSARTLPRLALARVEKEFTLVRRLR
jgi:hypothetical protein